MELINQCQFAAHLFRGCVDEDQIFATLVVRLGYVVRADGKCEPIAPADPVRLEDKEEDGQVLEDDAAPQKEGVDLCVIGRSIPRTSHATKGTVSVKVGDTERSLRITGDRTWELRRGADLKSLCAKARKGDFEVDAFLPSAPAPFEAMPIHWSRSFGGLAAFDGNQVPHAENPSGRGFLLVPDTAAGTLLPNIEDPQHPVAHWRDWPMPVCFAPCPRTSKLRMDRGIQINKADETWVLKPAYFSVAHPWLVFQNLKPECPISVQGMTPNGRFEFRLPSPPLEADVIVGRSSLSTPLRLDTVEVFPEKQRLSLAMRTAFRYYIHPGEHRVATVGVSRGQIG